ncbi:MAG: glycosyltransferase family 1 protein, partial [Candidatus Aenigmarchaeota archaeon]|nr:glycosyltransferase family 1 protein [Candidatus Aenigmarchaeota archaeon]MCK5452202.1 glycosyltransferase family 1 protein [Candidatus Aenigmarchaeota archaeon]
ETISHDIDGIKVWPESSNSLAWGICRVLGDRNFAASLSENAYKKIEKQYNWSSISTKLKLVYDNVSKQYSANDWKPSMPISQE